MEPDQADRLVDLVAEALERAPEERRAFLDAECGANEALRIEVESLIGQEEVAGEFLQTPAFAQAGKNLYDLEAGNLKPGDNLGDCQIIRLLGEGGMGEVYLAQDTGLERLVAVKLLKTQLDDDTLQRRFRHERKVLAGLTHPNIARLYGGAITPDGRSYLVMEYVDGERLDRYCATRDLPLTERLALFRKICAAVAYAHQNLVIHRDLKPANIRVTAEGEPKLLDFGIAKLLDPEGGTGTHVDPTVTLSAAMTPEYASPEQLQGETITTSSDVYSLGVILYELLCGQRPYAALKSRRPDELVRAICEQEPPRPSTVVGRTAPARLTATMPEGQTTPTTREVPSRLRRLLAGDLDNIVAKALRKEPGRRYPGASAFSEDIRRHREGLPVLARKDTLGYRAGKFVRRNRVGVLAVTLVSLALVGGLVATAWQARVARQERDRARAALANAETARKQTQQINDFLQKLLGSASPYKLGKDAKVIQVLDAASASVDQTLANEPEVLAEVHRTLGTTYLGLGMLGAAEPHYRAALALCQRLYGAEDGRTVAAEDSLAHVESNRNRHEEAVKLFQHVTDWLRQHPTGYEDMRGNSLSSLGFDLGQLHRFPEAERALNDSLAFQARTFGENSPKYAIGLENLGSLKREEGELEAAVKFNRRALVILCKVAPDTTETLIAELNLCFFLVEADRFSDVETLLGQTKDDCRRIVGETNNIFYTNVLFISELLDFQRDDFAKVAGSGKEVLDRFAAYLPHDDLDVVTTNYLLGASLTRIGRAEEGESYLRKALTNFDPAKRAFFLVYGNAETALGDCLLAQKRYAEAEPLLLIGYHKLQKDPNEPVAFLAASVRLHDFYIARDKPADAERFAAGGVRQDSKRP